MNKFLYFAFFQTIMDILKPSTVWLGDMCFRKNNEVLRKSYLTLTLKGRGYFTNQIDGGRGAIMDGPPFISARSNGKMLFFFMELTFCKQKIIL